MSYDEEQQRKSRVVVETPTARREVTQTQTTRIPEPRGISTGAVVALVIAAVALTSLAFLLLTNRDDATANVNERITPAPTPAITPATIVQQPPIVQQAPPVTAQVPPVIISPPMTSAAMPSPSAIATPTPVDDATVRAEVNQKILDDAELSATDIKAAVSRGTATLTGTVSTASLKRRAEQVARTVKGVRGVTNQVTIADDLALPPPQVVTPQVSP